MRTLSLDFETKSRVNIKTAGTSRYARDGSTRVLLCAYQVDGGEVRLWRPAEGERMPEDLRRGLQDRRVIKRAWNAAFEMHIVEFVLGLEIDLPSWRDTMVNALACGLPGKLEKCGPVIGLPADKQKDDRGRLLIRRFTQPRVPTKSKPWEWDTHETSPGEWEEFCQYCVQDVVAETAVWARLREYDLPPHEWDLWHLDQRINRRGLPVNMRLVAGALRLIDAVTEHRLAEMVELTGLDNPNSQKQLLEWLQARGYPFLDLKKGHVSQAIEKSEVGADTLRVLELRRETSKTSIKKFPALARATDDDGRLRNTFQFAGAARTWRWGGRIFQPQNLPRPEKQFEKIQHVIADDVEHLDTRVIEMFYSKPLNMLSSCLRPVIQARPGDTFVKADLNAIENRVLGWMADDRKILRVFHDKLDPYLDFATYLYSEDYETLAVEYNGGKGDGAKRQISKPAVLGCGYMLGPGLTFENEKTGEIEATGLLGYAWNMGVKYTLEQAQHGVSTWRGTFKDAVDFWFVIERAAMKCVETGRRTEAGPLDFVMDGPFLRMLLPSGRSLFYCRPKLENKMMPWGKMKWVLTYEQEDDNHRWVRTQTHPGKLTENADQAISRDVLAHGMTNAYREGLKRIFLHVHDEIVVECREDRAPEALKLLEQCMADSPPWARDLPLAAKGGISRYFIKD